MTTISSRWGVLLGLLAACGPTVSEDAGDSVTSGRPGESSGEVTETPGATSDPTPSTGEQGASSDPGETSVVSSSVSSSVSSASSDTGDTRDGPCSTFEQDCPAGQKCSPYANDGGNSWNATRCVPIVPEPNAVGEACTVEGDGTSGLDTCDGSSMCFNLDADTLEGTCHAFCTGDFETPACPEASECSITGDGVVNICIPNCDPIDPRSCAGGSVCVPSFTAFLCASGLGEDARGPFEPCEFVNHCGPGLFCANADVNSACGEDSGCCVPLCDLDNAACAEPAQCVPFFQEGETPAGYEHVGFCSDA